MSPAKIRTSEELVDYAATLDCIHCGLCLETCPTYQLTGVETSSPRGRIHLMRAVAENNLVPDDAYRDEMEFCLVCRHCESVCPAGVRMGEMMSVARDSMHEDAPRSLGVRLARWLGFRVLLPNRAALRISGSLLRFAQKSGLLRWLAEHSPVAREQFAALAALPTVAPANLRRMLPARSPAIGSHSSSQTSVVSMFEGCVMPELYSQVNRATETVLTRLGAEVCTNPAAVCCGALHAHNGDLAGARSLAQKLINAYEPRESTEDSASTPIVVNSAGCSAHMKELAHLFDSADPWHARAEALAKRIVDFSEYVAPRLAEEQPDLRLDLSAPITWDNPCHLCHGQSIREQPLDILRSIDFGSNAFVELEGSESCCGSAGIYSALRPQDSADILDPKLDALKDSGAKLLITSNPGCQMQWQSGIRRRGLDVEVKHLAEVLDDALSRSVPESELDANERGE